MSKRDGKPVDPAAMSIHTSRTVTMDEFKPAEAREFALYAERFANFGECRAVVLAVCLFPSPQAAVRRWSIDEASARAVPVPRDTSGVGKPGSK
jgi:hypothetical protein